MFQRRFNLDYRILRTELNGIVNQIVKHLLNLHHICMDKESLSCEKQLNGDPPVSAGSLKGSGCGFDHIVDIKIRVIQMTSFLIQVIQSQKTFCQLIEPVCFKHYDLQIFFLEFGRNGSVQDGFGVTFDRGQRGAEVMGNISDKFPLIAAGHIQLVGHIIQSQGQIAQLVFFVQWYVVFQISGGKGIRPLDNLFQRTVDHKGKYRNDQGQNCQKNKK